MRRSLCVDFSGSCGNIPRDRRYLLLSVVSLWFAVSLSLLALLAAMAMLLGRGGGLENMMASKEAKGPDVVESRGDERSFTTAGSAEGSRVAAGPSMPRHGLA